MGLTLAVIGLLGAGCDDAGDPTGPGGDAPPAEIMVDASQGWAYVELAEEASAVTVADPSSSTEWDLGVFATSVMLNGGAAGPAGVVGYCVCGNEGVTDADVMAMTPETELDAFEAVGSDDVPASDDAWVADTLAPAISGWYAYDPQTHVVSAAPEQVWKVRTAEGEAYAKLHVIGIADASQQNAGSVTIEYAVQPAAGEALGGPDTAVVDVSAGAVHFDLVDGAVSSDASDWDLRFEGYTIQVNGGVSGDGDADAVLVDEDFGAITDAGDVSARHYRGDAFGGVFSSHKWYRYNLDGQHQIWPTYQVYLIKRGDAVYKVQLTGYYDDTGESRRVTLRYAPVTD